MFDQPIDELLGHKAVWVRPQVVPPILDHLPLVESQPGGQKTGRRKEVTQHDAKRLVYQLKTVPI